MDNTKSKFSLKRKLVTLIVCIIMAIILLEGVFSYKGFTDSNRYSYTTRSKQLASTAAALIDPQQVKNVKNQVLEVYNSIDDADRVSSEYWGEPELEEYLSKFEYIMDTDDYKDIKSTLTIIQDTNELMSVYIIFFDMENENTIYLVDASNEYFCAPGCFDDVMYQVDYDAMKDPHQGIASDITNTDEYGWLVATASPIYLGNEFIAFAAVDISMNLAMAQRNQFLVASLIALLILAVVALIISLKLMERAIINPINELSNTSKKYWSIGTTGIQHQFENLDIHTGDEIEALSNSMKQMEKNINKHITKLMDTTQKMIDAQEHASEMDVAANVDALTQIRNKRAYDAKIEKINVDIQAGKTEVGLAMIDLNFLKVINDIHGHEKGDKAIKTLSETICNIFSHSPVFRIGGDEFVVILRGSDLINIEDLEKEFKNSVSNKLEEEKPWEHPSTAIGIAFYDASLDKDMSTVLKRADQSMYKMKKQMKAIREN